MYIGLSHFEWYKLINKSVAMYYNVLVVIDQKFNI